DVREGKLDFNGAVLSSKLADDLGAGPGDAIDIVVGSTVVTLEVTGVVQEAIALMVYTSRDVLAPIFPPRTATAPTSSWWTPRPPQSRPSGSGRWRWSRESLR
ncbi:MAG: hypothetical protein KAQ96_04595, partial [Thermoplasmata archaeon]|nr:hypothetical protein [Thermoplasmata archaeon]